ncbi:hypothetical protein GN958_ATG12000, partial [Phytophthora infestans]
LIQRFAMEGGHGAHGGDPPSPEEESAADPLGKALTEKAPRLVWTDSRLRTLLHLRLIAYGDQFNKHKSRAQLTVLWSRVVRRFNKQHETKAVVDQLRNKFNAMKALFGQIRADEATTGNLEKAVKYPSYWSVLVEFFADKKGLRNQDFGQLAEGSDDEAVVYDRGASGGDNACSEIHQIESRKPFSTVKPFKIVETLDWDQCTIDGTDYTRKPKHILKPLYHLRFLVVRGR